jgi:hypothetical protein
LEDVRIDGVEGWRVDLGDARLRRVSFQDARLGCSFFQSARIEDSVFRRSTFHEGSHFTDARILRTTFEECDLTESDWRRAHFEDSGFRDCRLGKSSWEGATGIEVPAGASPPWNAEAAAVLEVYSIGPPPPDRTPEEFHAGLLQTIDSVVQALSEFRIEIAYDRAGLARVEEFIETHREHWAADDVDAVAFRLGLVVGECILRDFGCRWEWTEGDAPWLALPTGERFFPITKTAKQIRGDRTDSVLGLYNMVGAVIAKGGFQNL